MLWLLFGNKNPRTRAFHRRLGFAGWKILLPRGMSEFMTIRYGFARWRSGPHPQAEGGTV